MCCTSALKAQSWEENSKNTKLGRKPDELRLEQNGNIRPSVFVDFIMEHVQDYDKLMR